MADYSRLVVPKVLEGRRAAGHFLVCGRTKRVASPMPGSFFFPFASIEVIETSYPGLFKFTLPCEQTDDTTPVLAPPRCLFLLACVRR